MTHGYREFAPSPHLAPFVECFWTGQVSQNHAATITPDGCADILFITHRDELVEAQIVGVMTRPHLVQLSAETCLLGVRFQPGMAGACLRCDVPRLNDRVVPLQSVCGSSRNELIEINRGRVSIERRIVAMEDQLSNLPAITAVQKAIGELVGRRGELSLGDFATAAGVGERQLRRTCLKHSGLSPKQLSRILRLRNALRRLRNGESNIAELAIRCGYFDQAHMNRDFRELAGTSPLRWLQTGG